MSLPQIDEAFICSSTCPYAGSGTSTSTCLTVLSPGRTTPFIVDMTFLLDRDRCRTRAVTVDAAHWNAKPHPFECLPDPYAASTPVHTWAAGPESLPRWHPR